MQWRTRAVLLSLCALGTLGLDVGTKLAPHAAVAGNYSRMPVPLMVVVGLALVIVGVSHSNLVAAGAGLMLGGLAGNGGQILLAGYATDWIPLGGWLTNVADLAGAMGLGCCGLGFLSPVVRGATRERRRMLG